MTTSRCIKIAVLVPLLALCTSTYADAHRAIVAGSFNDRNNAVAFQDQVAQKLGGVAPAAQVDIAATTVRNKPYFRVIIHEPGKQSDSAVHTLLDAVRKSGFPSSWVTRLNTTTTASQPMLSAAKLSPAKAPITSAAQTSATTVGQGQPTEQQATATEATQSASGLLSNAGDSLMNVGDSFLNVLSSDLPSLFDSAKLATFATVSHHRYEKTQEASVGATLELAGADDVRFMAAIRPDFFEKPLDNLMFRSTVREPLLPDTRQLLITETEKLGLAPKRADKTALFERRLLKLENSQAANILPDSFMPEISSFYSRRIGERSYYSMIDKNGQVAGLMQAYPTPVNGIYTGSISSESLRYSALLATESNGSNSAFSNRPKRYHPSSNFLVHSLSVGDADETGLRLAYVGAFRDRKSFNSETHEIRLDTQHMDGLLKSSTQLFASRRADSEGLGGRVFAQLGSEESFLHEFQLTAMDTSIDLNDTGYLQRNDFADVSYTLRSHSSRQLQQYLYAPFDTSRRPIGRLSMDKIGFELNAFQRHKVSTGQVLGRGITAGGFILGPQQDYYFANVGYFPSQTEDLDTRRGKKLRVPGRGWLELGAVNVPLANEDFRADLSIGQAQELTGAWSRYATLGLSIDTYPELSLRTGLNFSWRDDSMIYNGINLAQTADYAVLRPFLDAEWTIYPNQQVSVTYQFLGLRQSNRALLLNAPELNHAQSVGQIRYLWRITNNANLSVLYTHGAFVAENSQNYTGSLRYMLRETMNALATDDYFSAKLNYMF